MAAPKWTGYNTKIVRITNPLDDLEFTPDRTFLRGTIDLPILKEPPFPYGNSPVCPNCENTWNVTVTTNSQWETFLNCPRCNWIIRVVRAALPGEGPQVFDNNPAIG